MPSGSDADHALEEGRRRAREVLDRRRDRRASRRSAIERRAAEPPPPARRPAHPADLFDRLGPPSDRVLLAEGDSWFDFPWTDVLKELEDEEGFDVESVSHKGDSIEQMAYAGGQLDELTRHLEKLVRNGRIPEAILLSGGGNDVAGDEFAVLLNHANSPSPGLNEKIVEGLLDDRVRPAHITVLSEVSEVCHDLLGAPLPILVHGYGHAVPDGRGFWSGWGPLPGPWLEPGFEAKGYANLDANKAIVADLIDRFNEMLAGLPNVPGLEHVRHVDVRPVLDDAPATYRDWWSDELHPTERGFRAVARRFVEVLDA